MCLKEVEVLIGYRLRGLDKGVEKDPYGLATPEELLKETAIKSNSLENLP
ncbi:hypothetical protein [Algoriphagus lacus]|nr:hypothetical protein [Algoriphagus lacus]